MISILEPMSANESVGILARLALSLGDPENPAYQPHAESEAYVRKLIVEELASRLGLRAEITESSIAVFLKAIDDEIDALTPGSDSGRVMEVLGKEGRAPSDLYSVSISDRTEKLYSKRWLHEEFLIRHAIRNADAEYHVSSGFGGVSPVPLSMFGRFYKTKFPFRDFLLLIVAQRNGLHLSEAQAWHIYPSTVEWESGDNLLFIFRKFCEKLGAKFSINGHQGRFMIQTFRPGEQPKEAGVNQSFKLLENLGGRVDVTSFAMPHPDGSMAKIISASVNIDRYENELRIHHWAEEVKILHKTFLDKSRPVKLKNSIEG